MLSNTESGWSRDRPRSAKVEGRPTDRLLGRSVGLDFCRPRTTRKESTTQTRPIPYDPPAVIQQTHVSLRSILESLYRVTRKRWTSRQENTRQTRPVPYVPAAAIQRASVSMRPTHEWSHQLTRIRCASHRASTRQI